MLSMQVPASDEDHHADIDTQNDDPDSRSFRVDMRFRVRVRVLVRVLRVHYFAQGHTLKSERYIFKVLTKKKQRSFQKLRKKFRSTQPQSGNTNLVIPAYLTIRLGPWFVSPASLSGHQPRPRRLDRVHATGDFSLILPCSIVARLSWLRDNPSFVP